MNSAKVRERPRLWLPRVVGRAGRSRTLAAESVAQQGQKQISPYPKLIGIGYVQESNRRSG
jgi:hypothetical protein